ncbi:MAG: DUF4831 family protein [Candidatus Cryptobacteroides sp.]
MKSRIFVIAIAATAAFMSVDALAQNQASQGANPEGTLSYCLPSTSLSFEVEAVRETFHAGPYCKYASKYLGIEARQKDHVVYSLSGVKMTPYLEPDQSKRFVISPSTQNANLTFLKMTSCGLVSVSDVYGNESVWRFPAVTRGDFAEGGVSSNMTAESTVLYRKSKSGDAYDKVAVSQKMTVEKSPEKRAAETAALIFKLREKRLQIITGDTDATFSGEAMGAAIAEIQRLEQAYMSMFTGYSEYQTETMKFEIVPEKDRLNQMYVAFRISDSDGLLPADNLSGRPVLLEIETPEEEKVEETPDPKKKQGKPVELAYYRIPAICNVRLIDGGDVILTSRIPVCQLGTVGSFPLGVNTR